MKLKNKKALVTGGTKGIGRATAIRLAEEGADVVIVGRDEKALAEVHSLIEEKKRKALSIKCDISQPGAIERLFSTIEKEFSRLDILVNNAGGSQQGHSIHLLDVTEEQFDEMIDVNLKGTFLCQQKAIAMMIKHQEGGAIVNVSSQSGRFGNEFSRPHYNAAKAGQIALTRHSAREFGPKGIRINAVAPGHTITGERVAKIWEERRQTGSAERLLKEIALRRTSTPEEQAAVIVFLCTDDASFITGATIDVNGGRICI